MDGTPPQPDRSVTSEDDAKLAAYARELADRFDRAIAAWVTRSVERVLHEQGRPVTDEVRARAAGAGERARGEITPLLRELLDTDIDSQRANPLSIIRGATRWPTAVLRDAGAQPVRRDADDCRRFPDDEYGLTPASFSDIDPSLHEPGVAWGAAKAHVHLRRRRSAGR